VGDSGYRPEFDNVTRPSCPKVRTKVRPLIVRRVETPIAARQIKAHLRSGTVRARRTRRICLAARSPEEEGQEVSVEIATPTLTAIEWASRPQAITLTADALNRIGGMIDAPAKPTERLKAAAKRFKDTSKRRSGR
jgi:hypothetical protein